MDTVDIIIAVDAATLAEEVYNGLRLPGSKEVPTRLGDHANSDKYIYMIAPRRYVPKNVKQDEDEGKSELRIKANAGTTVCWVMTSFDSDCRFTAYLYSGVFNPGSAVSALKFTKVKASSYLPPGQDPLEKAVRCDNTVYVAEAILQEHNKDIQYDLRFALVDNIKGEVIGYFQWDPFITVTP